MFYYDKWVTRISTGMAMVAAVLLLTATLILTWMVFTRSIGMHSSWELELSIELMISAIFLGSPYTLATGGHVKMDLLNVILPARLRAVISFCAMFASFLICLYLGWEGLSLAYKAYLTGERGLGIWQPLAWPKYATIPLGMFMTCLQYIVHMRGMSRSPLSLTGQEQSA